MAQRWVSLILRAVSSFSNNLGSTAFSCGTTPRAVILPEAAIQAIDANTLLLLAAMMMLVAMLRRTGVFEYIAVVIARLAAHDPRLLLVYLSVAVSVISMFLDNVTTIIVFAPLTVLIARILELNPLPYLMSEAILSNIGGAATLVGDPQNLMIGSAAGIGFTEFLAHMGPMLAAAWIGTTLLLMFVFRRQLDPANHQLRPLHFDLGQAIKDARALRQVILALVLVITLFFIHHQLHIFPAFAALIGLVLAMVLVRPRPERLFGEVNWSVLVFFAGLFVIIGGVEASGLLELLGRQLAQLAREPSHLLLAGLATGLLISIFQAATQINEMTMTFIPKMLAVAVALLVAFPWMLQVLIEFFQNLLIGMPEMLR